MNGDLFPLWQVDRDEYAAVCRHLGLTPSDALYPRLAAHLAQLPFRSPAPSRFARFLARPKLTRWRVARLDLATRLLWPAHPVRHVLNAVIALHECDGRGFRELARAPAGAAVWPYLGWVAARFAAGALLTAAWVVLQTAKYAISRLRRSGPEPGGRCVLVTGAARGLGRDLMLHCLESGARVVGVVRSAAARDELLAELPAAAPLRLVVADLAQTGALAAALREAGLRPGDIDLAIASAGVKHSGQTALADEALRNTFAVNLFSAVELAGWLRSERRVDAHGRPVPRALALVSSMGRWHGMHGSAGYNASKAALSIWGESLEMDLRRDPREAMTVTIVEPGLFASAMTAGGLARRLAVSRRDLAEDIVGAALAGRRVLRAPRWFAWLTWGVCLAGRPFRARLFGRIKGEANRP